MLCSHTHNLNTEQKGEDDMLAIVFVFLAPNLEPYTPRRFHWSHSRVNQTPFLQVLNLQTSMYALY